MRKTCFVLTAVALVLTAVPAAALSVTITPFFYAVWVPWQECVQVSVSTSSSYDTYEWNYDGTIAGSSRNFTVPQVYCSKGLNYTWYEDHAIGVYVTQGGEAGYATLVYTVYYEPGNENGGCGTQIICDP